MLAEQLGLEDAAAGAPPASPVPSAWDWARAKWPGKPVIRVINMASAKQAFAVLEAEVGFLVDGSTHFINTPAGGLSTAQHDVLVAAYDEAWHEQPDHGRAD